MNVCAVIPAYNAASTIANVVASTVRHGLPTFLIDDGSTDETGACATAAGAHVIRHANNQGKGASIRTGIHEALRASADAVIFLDADGQHNPAAIPQFIAYAQQHPTAGVIVGNRMAHTGDMPLARRITNQVMSALLSRVVGQTIPDSQCGYRLVRSDVLRRLHLTTTRYEIESELLVQAARKGVTIHAVPIASIYEASSSHIHPWRDTVQFVRFLWAVRQK